SDRRPNPLPWLYREIAAAVRRNLSQFEKLALKYIGPEIAGGPATLLFNSCLAIDWGRGLRHCFSLKEWL
ncbi:MULTISPECIES: hypothetical protein, partial [Rhizobium]|uniref:hypothetical protein n=1 Tax=Rhizobium TaxID=379 RepID=UPI001A7E0721